jgi:lipopolysaccharide biosynthesis regulator YciM
VRASAAFGEHDLDAATTDVDKALELKDSLTPALLLKGRILEARGDKAAAKSRYQQAFAQPASFLEGRTVQRQARERLNALDGVDTADTELDTKPARNVGCKRFLPATGVTITIDCDR